MESILGNVSVLFSDLSCVIGASDYFAMVEPGLINPLKRTNSFHNRLIEVSISIIIIQLDFTYITLAFLLHILCKGFGSSSRILQCGCVKRDCMAKKNVWKIAKM